MKRWTENQKKAIERIDTDVIVSASAGSGKTSSMVERALSLVTNYNVPIERIMLLTYTNNSAQEMKERLRQGMVEYAKEHAESAEFIREQLDNMGLADISTIHGFCFKIVQEFFEIVGVSPSVGIQLPEECAEDYAVADKNTLKRCEKDPEIRAFMDMLSLRRDDSFLSNLHRLYEYLTAQPDRDKWLEECLQKYDLNNDFEQSAISKYASKYFSSVAKIYSDELRELVTYARQIGEPDGINFAINTLDRIQCFENCSTMAELYAALQQSNLVPAMSKPRKACVDVVLKESVDRLKKEFADNALKSIKSIFSCGENYEEMVENRNLAGLHVKQIVKAVKIFQEEYDKVKFEQNKIDFSDMERYTVQILEDPTIAEEIKNRHDYVFVDEYQDTNYIQDKIIRTITKPNRLFVVGDVKQCIYRFRLAEPGIFINTLSEWSQNQNAIYFNDNFRSDNEILNFVNHIFDSLMTSNFGNIDYKRTGHFTIRENPNKSEIEPVVLLKSTVTAQKENYSEKFKDENGIYDILSHEMYVEQSDDTEAGLIYNYIQSVLGKKIFIKGEERIVDYKDIVLMFRTRKQGAKVLDCLSKAGIPLNIGDFENTTHKKELDIFMDYISVINNLYDDYPLISALHSFIGGLSNTELAEIKIQCPSYGYFYNSCQEYMQKFDNDLAKKLKMFFNRVDEYSFLSTYTEMSEFLKLVLEQTGYGTYLASMPDGVRIITSVNGYIQSVKGKKYACDLRSLLMYYKSQDIKLTSAISVPNGVKVCTIHSSKGLEYPIVILAGNVNRRRPDSRDLWTDRELGVGVKYYDPQNRTISVTLDGKVIKLKKERDEFEDKLRLLYVALTRAESALCVILPDSAPVCKHPFVTDLFSSWFEYCMENDEYVRGKLKYIDPFVFDDVKKQQRIMPTVGAADENVERVISFEYPYKIATKTARKYSVSALNTNSKNIELPEIDVEERSFSGTAHHAVMQYIDLYATTKEEIQKELDRMLAGELLQLEQYNEIKIDEIQKCLNSPIGEMARNSVCYREHKFILSKEADEVLDNGCKESVLVQGIIDMLLVGDELVVVDFKRSKLSKELLKEKYKTQLKLYGDAVKQTYGKAPDRLLLYVFGQDIIIEI